MIGLGIAGAVLALNGPTRSTIIQKPFLVILYAYMLMGIVAGWNRLNKLTSVRFLALPIIGWFIYLVIKFYAAAIIGFFIVPFRIYKNIKRFGELNRIQNID